jgi:hypothetical protein
MGAETDNTLAHHQEWYFFYARFYDMVSISGHNIEWVDGNEWWIDNDFKVAMA